MLFFDFLAMLQGRTLGKWYHAEVRHFSYGVNLQSNHVLGSDAWYNRVHTEVVRPQYVDGPIKYPHRQL